MLTDKWKQATEKIRKIPEKFVEVDLLESESERNKRMMQNDRCLN
jgi:hypothetical protein